MKYVIVVPDGAADVPLPELGGKTPLQMARKPHMDWLAAHGKCGTVRTVPRNMEPGSDVAILSLLGYDPREFYTGRAPLEAAARGLSIGPDEWVFRCNLVTVIEGVMEDHSAGHISTEEATALITQLEHALGSDKAHFHAGVSYRHLLTLKADVNVKTTPPHDILTQPTAGYLPSGPGSGFLQELMQRSKEVLADHEVNQVRRDLGENPATQIWLWGQGKMPQLPSFASRNGVSGAAITAVDLVRGLAKLIGWDNIEVPGATGFLDSNFAGKGQAAIEALAGHDLVFVHCEATDECGHQADAKGKVQGLEMIDKYVVGPILAHLLERGQDWRMMVTPDHPTPCLKRTHTAEPVPFAMAGSGIASVVERRLTEQDAAAADLHIQRGSDLMEYFLKGS